MPFTVSHIAAVLPGYRSLTRARVFTAAVIGSMVPDFGLLLPGSFARWQTHGLSGAVHVLSAGGADRVLAHAAADQAGGARGAAGRGVPAAACGVSAGVDRGSFSAWLYAAAALLLGAVTHLIWDAFTHENARGVRMFPLLTDYGPEMAGHPLHLYRWLQYGSSLLGLAVVLAALIAVAAPCAGTGRAAATPHRPARSVRLWLSAYLLPSLLAMAWVG